MSTESTVALRAILKDEITAALRSIQKEIQQTSDGASIAGATMRQGFSEPLPTIQGVNDALGKQVAALRAQRDAMKTSEYQEYGTQMRSLQSEIKKMEADLWGGKEAAESQSNSWANLAGKLFIAQQAYQMVAPAIMSVVKAAADYDSIRTRLAATEGSTLIADSEMKQLLELAKLPGLGFEQAAQAMAALRSMRVSAQDAFSIIDGIAKANASMGGGAEQFGRVMYQLEQSVGKGKVMAEDMNAIKEAIPNLGALIEDAYGTSDSEKINKRLQDTGESVRSFWMNVSDMARKLPPAGDTINNNLDNISDNWKRFKANLVDSDFLKSVTGRLADFSEGLANTASKSRDAEEAARAINARGGLLGMLLGDATKAEQELAIINGEMERAGKAAGVKSFSQTSGSEGRSSYALYMANQKQKQDSDKADEKRKDAADKEKANKEAAKRAKKLQSEIDANRKEIDAFIAANNAKLKAQEAYNATYGNLQKDAQDLGIKGGVSVEVATIQASTDQQIAALAAGYDKQRALKGATKAQIAALTRQEAAEEAEIQQKATDKILAIYRKADNEALVQSAKNDAERQKRLVQVNKEIEEAQKKHDEDMKKLRDAETKRQATNADDFGEAWAAVFRETQSKSKSVWNQIAENMKSVMDTAVGSISSGFATMIVQGKSLRSTMASIGETIETQVIQSIIKMGLEWVEQQTIRLIASEASQAALLATGEASAAALGASWAGPAAAASIATLGGADAAGIAGMTTAYAYSDAAALGFAEGGGVIFGPTRVGERRAEVSSPTVPQRITQTSATTINHNSGGNSVVNIYAGTRNVAAVMPRASAMSSRSMWRESLPR